MTFLPDVSFTGDVLRTSGKPDKVILEGHGVRKEFVRHTTDSGGELPVSCDQGPLVPVSTINLHFREYNDKATDRGLVWVIPGNPARAYFILEPLSNGAAELVVDTVLRIVGEAQQVIESQVFRHFAPRQAA